METKCWACRASFNFTYVMFKEGRVLFVYPMGMLRGIPIAYSDNALTFDCPRCGKRNIVLFKEICPFWEEISRQKRKTIEKEAFDSNSEQEEIKTKVFVF